MSRRFARARARFVGKTVLRLLEVANLLVLTKTDLVSAEHQAAERAWLEGRAPGAPQIAAERRVLPLSVVFGAGTEKPGSLGHIDRIGEAGEAHEVAPETRTLHWDQPVPGDARIRLCSTRWGAARQGPCLADETA
jgi:G3E family GTPase